MQQHLLPQVRPSTQLALEMRVRFVLATKLG
jgi:hypothetical protein